MSESNKNRILYKCESKKDKNLTKYVIRIPINDENTKKMLEKKFEYLGIKFITQGKPIIDRNGDNIDKTGYYHFKDYMWYDNSTSKEYQVSHTYMYVGKEFSKKINDLLLTCKEVTMIKNDDTISVRVNDSLVDIDEKIEPTLCHFTSPLEYEKYDYQERGHYPICIVSYKRGDIKNVKGVDLPRTAILLNSMKVQCELYYEPQEHDIYVKNYGNLPYVKLVKCPENFSNLGQGSTPVRNYVLDMNKKCKKVWILDDNIKSFTRYYKGQKIPIKSGFIFKSVEQYVINNSILSTNKIGVVSLNYGCKVFGSCMRPVIVENGKSYSCMLIPTNAKRKNGSLIRFEGKHQEDNFLSLDFICNGYTTLCFNHIFYNKNTSGIDKGGNRESIYKDDEGQVGRKERSEFFINKTKEWLDQGIIKPLINKKTKEPYSLKELVVSSPQKNEEEHMRFCYEKIESVSFNPIDCNEYLEKDDDWKHYKKNVKNLTLIKT